MKKFLLVATIVVLINGLHAQSTVDVKFLYNNKPMIIEKEQVRFSARDTIQIHFQSKEPISVEEIWVQPLNIKTADPKQQQQQKVVQVTGDYKKYRGFTNQKKYSIKIPVSAFQVSSLSRLKINVVNCTNSKGEKLIKSNKVYEIVSQFR